MLLDDIPSPPKRVLIVENDPSLRLLVKEALSADDFHCKTVASAEDALRVFASRASFDLMITDYELDGIDGLELIGRVHRFLPMLPVLMMSGHESSSAKAQALRAGAVDFLEKPLDLNRLLNAAHGAARSPRSCALLLSNAQMLSALLGRKSIETQEHTLRVSIFSSRLGAELGLSECENFDLELGALLHDVGKLEVPSDILRKPAPLTSDEWVEMRKHPQHGEQMLSALNFPKAVAAVAEQHHERWDGGGYPHSFAGERIAPAARIFSVADAFDAITSDRVYRRGKPYEAALEEISAHSGTQFDPSVVSAFVRIPREEWELLRLLRGVGLERYAGDFVSA